MATPTPNTEPTSKKGAPKAGAAKSKPILSRSLVTGGDPDAPFDVPDVSEFTDEDDPQAQLDFIKADDIRPIALALIKERSSLKHLKWASIEYLWKREGGKSGGKATLGKCQKPSGLLKHYAEVDFVIWFAADWCKAYQFDAFQIEALVFHELKHAGRSEDGKPQTLPHDFEGFAEEIRHYGAWKDDIESIERAFQPTLFDSLAEHSTPANGKDKTGDTVELSTVVDGKKITTGPIPGKQFDKAIDRLTRGTRRGRSRKQE